MSTRIYSEKNAEMLIMIYFFEEKNLNMTVGWDGFVRFESEGSILRKIGLFKALNCSRKSQISIRV